MIKFIVIEDDKHHQEKVKNLLRTVTFESDEEIKILVYQKFTSKLREEILDKSDRKIFVIDIELEGNYSGVQIAKLIRENDWESEIIFMTNHDKMFETVYRNVYKVFDFIEKFHSFDSRLEKDIKEILKMNFDNKMFIYHGRNIDLHVFYKEILYIYRDTEDRKVVIVTTKNKFSVGLSIQDTLDQLDNRFKLVHRACIANLDHVQKFNWKDKCFVLDNGTKVDMLSKKYKKEVEVK
ncbi:MAG: response regulator transcription factor [Bacilli bacterium]|nr:response regulator transcription factor [Bacilli bacterium]